MTLGPDQHNVLLAWPDSRSHGKYITHESVWGRTMRHDCIQTLGMMSSQHFLNPFQCRCTIYEIKLLGTHCVANALPHSILNFIFRSMELEGSNTKANANKASAGFEKEKCFKRPSSWVDFYFVFNSKSLFKGCIPELFTSVSFVFMKYLVLCRR